MTSHGGEHPEQQTITHLVARRYCVKYERRYEVEFAKSYRRGAVHKHFLWLPTVEGEAQRILPGIMSQAIERAIRTAR